MAMINKTLKQIRINSLGFSAKEMADKLNMPVSEYEKIENERPLPSDLLIKVAQATGKSMEFLLNVQKKEIKFEIKNQWISIYDLERKLSQFLLGNRSYIESESLLTLLKKMVRKPRVAFVGRSDAGKSTLINKLLKNYSTSDRELTISPLPSTTLNTVEIEINEYLTLIDTPGLVDSGSIVNYISEDEFKKISPRKEIKPKTFQVKKGQSIYTILNNHSEIKLCEKTIYNYIEIGLFKDWGVTNLTLKRKVRRKVSKKKLKKRRNTVKGNSKLIMRKE